jgi:TRAP-type mannitol/chloroaromatic compound transport system permease small subunit
MLRFAAAAIHWTMIISAWLLAVLFIVPFGGILVYLFIEAIRQAWR